MGPLFPPMRPITDPEAEVERLARERTDPPSREWGVRHPDGRITVHVTGQAFESHSRAEATREACDRDCGECDGGTHTLVMRDKQPWRDA
jgi:hypothetical protein